MHDWEVLYVFNSDLLKQIIDMLPLYIGEAIFSCLYISSFLSARLETKQLIFLWTLPTVILEELLFAVIPNIDPWHDPLWIIARVILLLLLQRLLFKTREPGMHAFLTSSIIAAVYLTKYLIVMPYTTLSDLVWGRIMPYLLNKNILDGILTTYGTRLFVIILSNGLIMIVNGIWGVFCMYFILNLIKKAYTRKQDYLENTDAVFLCAPCITSVTICIALLIIMRKDANAGNILFYNDIPYMRLIIMIICVLLIATIYVAIVLLQQQLARRDDAKISAMQEAHITQLSKEINDLNEIYSDLRSLRHDMNNHIENLSALFMSCSSSSEIEDYLDRMRDTTDRLTLSYSTGNPVCDIILHRKKTAATYNNISFECDFSFPEETTLDAYDVGVILDNALDNALTATTCPDINSQNRYINLRSWQKGHLYFIEAKNPFIGDITIDPKTYLPLTNKRDQTNHGLGLATICRISEKYHGSAQADISYLDNTGIFSLTVMLRLR